jgi:hypothetical protein
MLISPIDRNNESELEKQVSRINSPYWTLPINGGLGSPSTKSPHTSEGIILRARDTRLKERRKNPSSFENVKQERRQRNNRKHDPRWNSASHHILVIALERKAGAPELWKAGDRVSVVSKTGRTATLIPTVPNTQKDKLPLLTKDSEDYVVHLSHSYPPER